MVKTSFRLPDDAAQRLAQLADKCHNGNRTAALLEALRRYEQITFPESAPVETIGWVNVIRLAGKPHCGKCNAPIDSPGYARLGADGSIDGRLFCAKCAK
jgi:hypothetical protein